MFAEADSPQTRNDKILALSPNVVLGTTGAFVCALAWIVLSVVPAAAIVDWAVRIYSSDGVLSAEGLDIVTTIIVKIKVLLAMAALSAGAATLFVWRAERRAGLSTHVMPTTGLSEIRIGRVSTAEWVVLLGLAVTALAVSLVHAGDSFYGDELDTIVLVAPTSVARIFGLHLPAAANVPGNHILNSLLTHALLKLGFRSELALRAWSLGSHVLLVPITFWVAWLLGLSPGRRLAATALVASSPTLDRYGIAVRGYELAALFATVAVGFHLAWLRRPRHALSLLAGGAATICVLANIFTVPIFVALLAHTLYLPFDAHAIHSWGSSRTYREHVTALVGFFLVSIALHTFMLPHLVYGSVVWSTISQLSVLDWLGLFAAPLLPAGLPFTSLIGGAVLGGLLFSAWQAVRADSWRRTTTTLLLFVCMIGLASFLASGQTGGRVVIYLVPTLCLTLVSALFPMSSASSSRVVQTASAFIVLAICAGGVWWAASRPPLSNTRAVAAVAEGLANGRPIWTSINDEKVVAFTRFYLPTLRVAHSLAEAPRGSTVYVRYDPRAHQNDAILPIVIDRCVDSGHRGLYDCPDFNTSQ